MLIVCILNYWDREMIIVIVLCVYDIRNKYFWWFVVDNRGINDMK